MTDHHTVTFAPSGRGKARCPADPAYPNGIAIDPAGPDAPGWCGFCKVYHVDRA